MIDNILQMLDREIKIRVEELEYGKIQQWDDYKVQVAEIALLRDIKELIHKLAYEDEEETG